MATVATVKYYNDLPIASLIYSLNGQFHIKVNDQSAEQTEYSIFVNRWNYRCSGEACIRPIKHMKNIDISWVSEHLHNSTFYIGLNGKNTTLPSCLLCLCIGALKIFNLISAKQQP